MPSNHDLGWLKVAMDNAACMRESNCLRYIDEYRQLMGEAVPDRKITIGFKHLRPGRSPHQFHSQQRHAVRAEPKIVNGYNVGVFESRGNGGFAGKELEV